jgi:hypothetical protein
MRLPGTPRAIDVAQLHEDHRKAQTSCKASSTLSRTILPPSIVCLAFAPGARARSLNSCSRRRFPTGRPEPPPALPRSGAVPLSQRAPSGRRGAGVMTRMAGLEPSAQQGLRVAPSAVGRLLWSATIPEVGGRDGSLDAQARSSRAGGSRSPRTRPAARRRILTARLPVRELIEEATAELETKSPSVSSRASDTPHSRRRTWTI